MEGRATTALRAGSIEHLGWYQYARATNKQKQSYYLRLFGSRYDSLLRFRRCNGVDTKAHQCRTPQRWLAEKIGAGLDDKPAIYGLHLRKPRA
jgi:hypothetical protein